MDSLESLANLQAFLQPCNSCCFFVFFVVVFLFFFLIPVHLMLFIVEPTPMVIVRFCAGLWGSDLMLVAVWRHFHN